MRIVHVINQLSGGGAERLVPQIQAEHRKAGLDSWVIGMGAEPTLQGKAIISFGKPVRRWRQPLQLRWALHRLEEQVGRIDILHTHLTQSQLFGPWAAGGLKRRPKLVTTEHDTAHRRLGTWWGKPFDRRIYRRYSRIACISEAVRDMLVHWQPQTSGKLVVIPNGIDGSAFGSSRRCDSRRPGPLRLLSVGRLVPKKGYATAMEALGALHDFDWEWTLVGEGEEREALASRAREKGIAERVHFAGFVEDPRPYYDAADLFLMPSRWEGFGLVAAEAMASGVPVLASKVPGLAEIVGHNGTAGGWLIPPESPHEWRRVLSRLLSDPEGVWIPPARCRERAKEFGIEKTADAYWQMYDSVLSQ